jgi:ribosomal protein L14E/L6E/L27E
MENTPKIAVGDIVLNLNGRDAGRFYVVTAADGELLTLADGRGRRIEKPKRKKTKHVRWIARGGDRTAQRLRDGEKVTNAELRRTLSEHAANPEKSEEVRSLG